MTAVATRCHGHAVYLICVLLLATGCTEDTGPSPAPEPAPPTVSFVGSETCIGCHAEQGEHWRTSHHALAMQAADPNTVLATLPAEVGGVRIKPGSTADDADFYVVDEQDRRWPVTHTFGVYPLQQYLADLGDGALHALRASWDSRPTALGGQRWYEQYAGEDIPPGDVLHWQGDAQNWNSMCADCHVVGFNKNFDLQSESYRSTFAEMGVGCEACHGPGSAHKDDPTLGLPAADALADPARQADVCAACHSRRAQLAEGFFAGDTLLDYYLPQLLNPPLYHVDGQIDDEVYVYGSFTASRMYQQGVTCNDCHDAHTAELKITGDGVCTQCHSPAGNARFPTLEAGLYASTEHHRHPPDSPAARCVTCHMPSKVYMGVDVRHDHSLRIPRPDLADVPNPCSSCHSEGAPDWPHAYAQNYVDVFVQHPLQAEQALAGLVSDTGLNNILRATAVSRLGGAQRAETARVIEQASRDLSALVRHASVDHLGLLPPNRQVGAYRRLLADATLSVRTQAAAAAMANLAPEQRNRLQPALDAALDEYRAVQRLNAERPEAHVNLASIALPLGNLNNALEHLDRALALQPGFVPALLNKADVLRASGRDAEAQNLLLAAVSQEVSVPMADYAYAMWLVRNGSRELALVHLGRAYRSEPENPQWAYAYVIALHSLGQGSNALELLRSLRGTPIYQAQFMFLHASIARDLSANQPELLDEAHALVDALIDRAPGDRRYHALKENLNTLQGGPDR